MTFDDLLPPVSDLALDFDEAISMWRWLIPGEVQPLLITAFGDLFLQSGEEVRFLDTLSGSISPVAESRELWKQALRDAENINTWFLPGFVEAIRASGQHLEAGEVFSPVIPPVLGGSMSVENFTPSQWRMHLHVFGQIHEQVRSLPPGTKIDKINVDPLP